MRINSINPIMPRVNKNSYNLNFGRERTSLETFISTRNEKMYKPQRSFQKPEILKESKKFINFSSMCSYYGCSKNMEANALFIENQILTDKSISAITKREDKQAEIGMLQLYAHNSNNVYLSRESRDKLLDLSIRVNKDKSFHEFMTELTRYALYK